MFTVVGDTELKHMPFCPRQTSSYTQHIQGVKKERVGPEEAMKMFRGLEQLTYEDRLREFSLEK